jgi:hypothetical protein
MREQRIKDLEKQITEIFNRETIGAMACIKGKALIEEWKVLTGWTENKGPVLQGGFEEMFIDKPILKAKLNETRGN